MAPSARHTWASRTVVVVVVALALLQLWWSDLAGSAESLSTAGLLFPVSLLSAALLARVNCFESRLAVVLACGVQLVVITLGLVVGLPGEARQAVDLSAVEALLLPLAGLALIELDRRMRRLRRAGSAVTDVPPSYAR